MAKTAITWHRDEFGRALVGGIHDGRIVALHFVERQSLSISIAGNADQRIRAQLSGVREMNICELWNGAIVSALYVWGVRDLPDSLSQGGVSGGWGLLFADRFTEREAKEAAARIALKYPKAQFVQVDCSYGGKLAAVCDDIMFFEDDESGAG